MQRADMRLRLIFTELMYIQLTIIFLQRFVPLFLQKIQYSLEIFDSLWMCQVCLVAYPRLIHLIAIKRRVGIDYLKNIFDNGAFIMLGQEVGKSLREANK